MKKIEKAINTKITKLINENGLTDEELYAKTSRILDELQENNLSTFRLWSMLFSRNKHSWLIANNVELPAEERLFCILLINYNFYLNDESKEKVKLLTDLYCQKDWGSDIVLAGVIFIFRMYGAFLVDESAYPLIDEISQRIGMNKAHLAYLKAANKAKFFGNLQVNLFETNPAAIEELKRLLDSLKVQEGGNRYFLQLKKLRFINEGFKTEFKELLTNYQVRHQELG